jgi:lipopolysaccharide/colanic/teichoic acid biosynthesis glycosyltransferase
LERPISKASYAGVYGGLSGGARFRATPVRVAEASAATDLFGTVTGTESWKRRLDVAVSVAALVLSAPIVGLAAVLVKATTPGPLFVSQERIGLNRRVGDRRNGHKSVFASERRFQHDRRVSPRPGKPFKLYKFRSMRRDAENGHPMLTMDNDPRITRVGRILRKARIDEIPQFVNVLRGDMSIVGPRPEREYFYGKMEHEVPGFTLRLRAKPGITGLAQVNQGYANSVKGMQIKLHHDLEYIRNVRLSTDAKILARTISVVLTGKGAC